MPRTKQTTTDEQRIENYFATAEGPSALTVFGIARGILIGRKLLNTEPAEVKARATRSDAGKTRPARTEPTPPAA
jgi:hypothetical protein